MELPCYFPTNANERLTGLDIRPVFQDFGRHGHVDLAAGESLMCTPQLQHANLLDRSRLCAQIPTVPLRSKPVPVTFPLCDSINGDLHCRSAKIRHFLKSMTSLRHFVKTKNNPKSRWHKGFHAAKRALDQIGWRDLPGEKKQRKLEAAHRCLPLSVRSLCSQYTELSQSPSQQAFNRSYSGGLLSCLKGAKVSSQILVHAEGPLLDQLCVTEVVESAPTLSIQHSFQKCLWPLFELDAASVGENVYICTRNKESCYFCSFPLSAADRSREIVQLDRQRFTSKERPTSVCASPFIGAECLVATNTGSVYIWSASQKSFEKVIADRQPRFECEDTWSHVQYGCHPRQLVVADRTAVDLFDHRSSFERGVELYALPSKFVSRSELIMATHTHSRSAPYHVMATQHCLFLLDQRFPGTPVMQWYPDLRGPLQYLASTDFTVDSSRTSSGVVVASQYPAEAMFYAFNHDSGCPVTMPTNPWRLSQIGDMRNIESTADHIQPAVSDQRFTTSLSGVGVLPGREPDSLWTYQSDAYGEVYFQYYSAPDDVHTADKTCNLRDRDNLTAVPTEVVEHVNNWLGTLQHQVDGLRSEWMKEHHQDKLERMKCPEDILLPEGECGVCMQCLQDIDSSSDDTDFKLPFCQACRTFLQMTTEGNEIGSDCTHPCLGVGTKFLDRCAPPLTEYPSDSAHTQVHLSLFNVAEETDLTEQLKQREVERAELKKEMKGKKKAVREKRRLQQNAETADTTSHPQSSSGEEQDQQDQLESSRRDQQESGTQDQPDSSTQDQRDGTEDQQSRTIENMISQLLEQRQQQSRRSRTVADKGDKTGSESDSNEPSLCEGSLLSDSEHSLSDSAHKSDSSSQRGGERRKKSGSEGDELGISAFYSLSDDEDFFGSQSLVFSPLHRSSQNSLSVTPGQRFATPGVSFLGSPIFKTPESKGRKTVPSSQKIMDTPKSKSRKRKLSLSLDRHSETDSRHSEMDSPSSEKHSTSKHRKLSLNRKSAGDSRWREKHSESKGRKLALGEAQSDADSWSVQSADSTVGLPLDLDRDADESRSKSEGSPSSSHHKGSPSRLKSNDPSCSKSKDSLSRSKSKHSSSRQKSRESPTKSDSKTSPTRLKSKDSPPRTKCKSSPTAKSKSRSSPLTLHNETDSSPHSAQTCSGGKQGTPMTFQEERTASTQAAKSQAENMAASSQGSGSFSTPTLFSSPGSAKLKKSDVSSPYSQKRKSLVSGF